MDFDGDKIRQLREARGWSTARLAAECFVRQETVESWERGDHQPGGPARALLLRAFGATEEELVA